MGALDPVGECLGALREGAIPLSSPYFALHFLALLLIVDVAVVFDVDAVVGSFAVRLVELLVVLPLVGSGRDICRGEPPMEGGDIVFWESVRRSFLLLMGDEPRPSPSTIDISEGVIEPCHPLWRFWSAESATSSVPKDQEAEGARLCDVRVVAVAGGCWGGPPLDSHRAGGMVSMV